MAHEELPNPLADFDIHTVAYKNVAGQDILADISFPKELQPGLHPLIINWHGGALVTGSRNFVPFYPPWLEPFARRNSAIVVSADYRLLPESKATEILEDLASFWEWLHSSLPTVLRELSHGEHSADLSRIVINGGSAGGWCAFQLALDHPDEVRALTVQYPQVGLDDDNIDPDDPRNGDKEMFGQKVWPKEKLTEYLENLDRSARPSEGGWERVPLFFASKAWGLLRQWRAGTTSPADRIQAGGKLPPKIWLMHGRDDSVVSVSSSEKLVPLLQKYCPGTELKVEYFPGEHGFDNRLDPKELENGLKWIESAW